MIKPVPHVGVMAAYALADLGDENTVSLAQNESAFPASPTALASAKEALGKTPLYPDPEWTDLRNAISEIHGLDPVNILCGAGSMELIGCLVWAFAGTGDEVLGTEYGYAFVASAVAQAEADYIQASEFDLTVSVDEILTTVTGKTKIVFVCNPGNPTGTLISNNEILRLRDGLPSDVILVIDQAYAEFSDGQNDPAEIFALIEHGDTVVTRTFSKAYGLAGLRAGWGYFPPEIVSEVRKLLNPNNISILSQAISAEAMRDQAYMKDVVAKTEAIRDSFAEQVRALGITVPQSHTNFVLLCFENVETAQAVDSALREEKLLLRGMGGYGLGHCLRATISDPSVIERVLCVLQRMRP
ncbi:MAG: histidinol-phosphate transaminase [Alphaproteobacteria bacterium]|jgi:histidinol-phosphate aminotransferase|nr:histidinol-phosphate transaminase [Alphaproteobacteria bacterium]